MMRTILFAIACTVVFCLAIGMYDALTFQPLSSAEGQRQADLRAQQTRQGDARRHAEAQAQHERDVALAKRLCEAEVGWTRLKQLGIDPDGYRMHDYAMCYFRRAP